MSRVGIAVCLGLFLGTQLLPSAAGSGSGKPDFSGNWVLDQSRSNVAQLDRGQLAKAEVYLVVSHREPELRIVRRAFLDGREVSQVLSYFSDGRGESNPPVLGAGNVRSKTRWEGLKLVSRSSAKVALGGQSGTIDMTEKRELSPDGKLMTITVVIATPRGPQTVKQVYVRS